MWIYPRIILLNDFRLVTLFLQLRGDNIILWARWLSLMDGRMGVWRHGTVENLSHHVRWWEWSPLPGAAPWLRMSCTHCVQWPGSGHSTPVQCSTHLANYGLLPGDTDLGTAQSESGTRQDNISHRENFYPNHIKLQTFTCKNTKVLW